ncbi:MAG: Holliday junction resolvase RuvX [Candidatus Tectomicrobia bacterium]|nr:Holliday junction resolvase RuvX [Candidatus Tectomicrobia bacterium]
MPERILALDVGERRIGVSVSDPLGMTAQQLSTLLRSRLQDDLRRLCELIASYEVTEIVVGLPRNMDGSLGPQARKVQEFQRHLAAACHLPMTSWDERLTSVAAKRAMVEQGVKTGKHKERVDQLAAQLLLQSYLDFRRAQRGRGA